MDKRFDKGLEAFPDHGRVVFGSGPSEVALDDHLLLVVNARFV